MNKLVEEFYGEMALYSLYKENIKNLEFEIELCYDKLGASPSSPPYDKVPSHSPPNEDVLYKIRDDIQRYEKKIEQKKVLVENCDSILNQMSDFVRKAITLKFINGLTWEEVGRKLYKSKNGVEYTCAKEITRIINFGLQTKDK